MTTSAIIADALSRARAIADSRDAHIIKPDDLSRSDREVLLATHWLQEIIRGWYILVRPDVATGDMAAWYANFWDFVRIYLESRFGKNYCLSAEASLDIHVQNPIIPNQVIVIVKKGTGLRQLTHHTSLMIYADKKNFPKDIVQKNGINIMSLGYALVKASPSFFRNNPRNAELALRSVKSADEITRFLIRDNLKIAAARLVGAYQFLKDGKMAITIKNDLKSLGILIYPSKPFENQKTPLLNVVRLTSPYAGRIKAMWAEARETVIKFFPKPLGLPKNKSTYLHKIDEIYQFDAYNSLSIEGYQVTNELIEKVKSQKWNPSDNEYDNNIKNAMAAKGYFDTFQQVKKSITKIINGKDAAKIIRHDLQEWYKDLFGPSVKAGIIPAESLFSYRNDRVFIRNSIHSPPPKEAIIDAMEAFFDCLENESHPGVNAILGHYFFVFIHPYMDGNGRIARFLMNAMLASGGYPWTVVRVDNRKKYISILEQTHIKFDMTAFTKFIKSEMEMA